MELVSAELSELRTKLDRKEVSSVELTKHFLAQIDQSDLNAFLTVTAGQALQQAQAADDFIATPGDNPALCGIPFAAKDLFLTRGVRTTAASKILDNYRS